MTIDANYIALSILNECMRETIDKATKGIETTGYLDHAETKITEEAKSYFRAQIKEYKQAVIILQGIHRELSDRLWNANKPKVEQTS